RYMPPGLQLCSGRGRGDERRHISARVPARGAKRQAVSALLHAKIEGSRGGVRDRARAVGDVMGDGVVRSSVARLMPSSARLNGAQMASDGAMPAQAVGLG